MLLVYKVGQSQRNSRSVFYPHPNTHSYDSSHACGCTTLVIISYILSLSPSLPSSTIVGICGKDGVVLGVEKLITSKLHEVSSNKRLFTIDRHVGIVSPGLHVTRVFMAGVSLPFGIEELLIVKIVALALHAVYLCPVFQCPFSSVPEIYHSTRIKLISQDYRLQCRSISIAYRILFQC